MIRTVVIAEHNHESGNVNIREKRFVLGYSKKAVTVPLITAKVIIVSSSSPKIYLEEYRNVEIKMMIAFNTRHDIKDENFLAK